MCGRFGFTYTLKRKVQERFDLANLFELESSYNIAPSQPALIVTRHSPNKAEIRRFGIEAPWKKDMLLINAQSETVLGKHTFAKMFRESRCLIPASFFYEWKRTKDGKQPYAFTLGNEKMFSLAGIYNDEGFVILTTAPSEVMKDIHNRQPLILYEEDENLWLNPDTDPDLLKDIMEPTQGLRIWPVSTLVNSPKNNFPEIVTPLTSSSAIL